MLYYKLDHIVIDQTSLLLEGIHQCLFANPVDHTGIPADALWISSTAFSVKTS